MMCQIVDDGVLGLTQYAGIKKTATLADGNWPVWQLLFFFDSS